MEMNALSDMQKQYNKLIARFNNASEFMDSDNPLAEKEKWQPEFNNIVNRLDDLIILIQKELGREMTAEEILNGFNGIV